MAKEVNYQSLQNELESILNDLQRDDIDVDQAMKQYERGLQIVKQLEDYLQSAENTVEELRAKFDKE
jgi:exodeoxyribonuclease VII small subunit